MGNVKDDGKKLMDPLFPRLHISDAEKGGPRTPPRNKMAISQHLNVSPSSQTAQRSVHGSMSRISPHSINKGSSLGPQSSSYHDASYKRSVFSSFGGRSTRMATRLDTYQSSGINLNFSLTTTVKQTIETTNCQALCDTGHLKRGDYRLYKPQEYRNNTRNALMKNHEEITDDYLIPSLCFGNGQNYTNRRKFPTLSTNRPDHTKHNPIVGPKLVELTDKDLTEENKVNTTLTITDITDEEPLPCTNNNSERSRVTEMSNGELMSPSHTRKSSISVEEPQTLHDMINIGLPLKRKIQENMTCKNGKSDTIDTDHEVVAPNYKNEEHVAGKVGDVIETNFVPSNNIITPEEVSRMIGPEQYCIIRRAIIQQQKAFQSQVFELHRLIKVQKLLAGSPELLREDSFYKLKRTPSEDIFPQVDHQHKKESLLTIPIDGTFKKSNHTNYDTDKRYYPSLIDLPPPPLPPPPPPSVINDSKQTPWCYLPPPPPGNQWLVPVRSPSEGLVYKPYTGPSPSHVGFMTPVYGMSLTLPSINSDFLTTTTSPYNNIPTSNYQQGIGVFPSSTPLFTSYGLPTISSKNYSCSPTIIENDVNYIKTTTTCNNLSTDQDNKESDLQGSSGSNYSCERVKDELPLFPTTPMLHETNQCTPEKGRVDERIKVIKVVPHNPKLASESAARIFQFIQEERKHNE